MAAYEAWPARVTRSGRYEGCARRKALHIVAGMAPENGFGRPPTRETISGRTRG